MQVSEVGAMNIFILMRSESGELELVTPPLTNGTILPGVTRQSVLDLAGMTMMTMTMGMMMRMTITLTLIMTMMMTIMMTMTMLELTPLLKVRERRITLPELLRASREERVQEIFTCGTAAIVSPVGRLK